jgi:hypothetical protein
MGIWMGFSAHSDCRHNQNLCFFLCYACNAKLHASANVMYPDLQPPSHQSLKFLLATRPVRNTLVVNTSHAQLAQSQRAGEGAEVRHGATLMKSSRAYSADGQSALTTSPRGYEALSHGYHT